MAMGILNNMAPKLIGFFLEEAPCGSTGLFTEHCAPFAADAPSEGTLLRRERSFGGEGSALYLAVRSFLHPWREKDFPFSERLRIHGDSLQAPVFALLPLEDNAHTRFVRALLAEDHHMILIESDPT
jgi:hypothetical protein